MRYTILLTSAATVLLGAMPLEAAKPKQAQLVSLLRDALDDWIQGQIGAE